MIELSVQATLDLTYLRLIGGRALNLTPVLEGPVDKFLSSWISDQFNSEGERGGSRWARRAPATIDELAQTGHSTNKIGRGLTDRMFSSLVNPGDADAIRVVTPQTITRGSALPYAVYFNLGARGSVQPPRPLFGQGISLSDEAPLNDIIVKYIVDGTV